MAHRYDILENPYYPKWQTWIYKLHLEAACANPVNDLFDIVNSVCDLENSTQKHSYLFRM